MVFSLCSSIKKVICHDLEYERGGRNRDLVTMWKDRTVPDQKNCQAIVIVILY